MSRSPVAHGGGPLAVPDGCACPGAGKCLNAAKLCTTLSGAWQQGQALTLSGPLSP
ncbi:MAG: hypothetical protein U5L74_13095 [Ideonella sp.]|nr:hypothetical protein [Ideonella sp.]